MSRKMVLKDNEEARLVFGPQDAHIRLLDQAFSCHLVNRGNELMVKGSDQEVDAVFAIVSVLRELVSKGYVLAERDVAYALTLQERGELSSMVSLFQEELATTIKGKSIRAKTLGQRTYIEALRKHDIVFGIGPAGTGKTYLAVVMAFVALKKNEVKRIVLTRPAVEAGENLGFLPGDLQEKVDPYLRPLYDALHDVMGPEQLARSMERGIVEVAPLAYMRGRTLDDAFVILDEAQNTTPLQMKMFLTRLGFGSKMVITGDITQIDLPSGKRSGLKDAMRVLTEIPAIAFVQFEDFDVVRHPVVSQVIRAYATDDEARG
nr:PhoH family protein [Bacilli bacterium]